MSKFGAQSRHLLKGFHSFKHYLPHLTLPNILAILNHPSFTTIRDLLPMANVNGKSNSLSVFIDRLLLYRNERELVKQSLLMLLDFDYRLDVPCIDLYVRLPSAMVDDLPSPLLTRIVTFVSSSLTVHTVRLVINFAKLLLENSKIDDLSGLLRSIFDSIGTARTDTVREPIINCLLFIIRTRGSSLRDAILSSAYHLIATSPDVPTAENIAVVMCSIIVKSCGDQALIATTLHSLYAHCRTPQDLANFGLFQPLSRLHSEHPEDEWGKKSVFLLLDPALSAFPRGYAQGFLETIVSQFIADEAAAFPAIVRPTTGASSQTCSAGSSATRKAWQRIWRKGRVFPSCERHCDLRARHPSMEIAPTKPGRTPRMTSTSRKPREYARGPPNCEINAFFEVPFQ
jgi:hypothetical protein